MRTSTGASFYYTTDALGSTILLTDSAQAAAAAYSYDSWGNATSSGAQAAANPWQYAGGYKDTPTGYTKFGARYYNPTTGRFTQPDPSSQEKNRYAYAQCNPINATDTTGRLSSSECSDLHKVADGALAYGAVATIVGTVTAETGVGAFVLGTGLGAGGAGAVLLFALDFLC